MIADKNFEEKKTFVERLITSEPFLRLLEHKRILVLSFIGLILLTSGIGYFMNRSAKQAAHDSQLARQYASKLVNIDEGSLQTEETKTEGDELNQLQALAKSNSLIRDEFAGVLAQELILKDGNNQNSYVPLALKRLQSSHLDFYKDFSNISYLSSKGELQNAYKKTQDLKLALEKQSKQTSDSFITLYAFTLLQKASLEKSLGLENLREKSIQELRAFLNDESEIKERINAYLQSENESLLDFLA